MLSFEAFGTKEFISMHADEIAGAKEALSFKLKTKKSCKSHKEAKEPNQFMPSSHEEITHPGSIHARRISPMSSDPILDTTIDASVKKHKDILLDCIAPN
jgi:hypothetical protein